MRTTSPRTAKRTSMAAGRMVSVFISRVPRVRAFPGRAALMAKFMAASRSREWIPAWAVPGGLAARAGGGPAPGPPSAALPAAARAPATASHQADDLDAAVSEPAVHVFHPGGGHRC